MVDILLLLLVIGAFAAAGGYALLCARLVARPSNDESGMS